MSCQHLILGLLILLVVQRSDALKLRDRAGELSGGGLEIRYDQVGHFPGILMPRGVMQCPLGQDIRSQHDCDAAFQSIITKYDYEYDRKQVLLVKWPHIPKGCSVSKGKAYFNTDDSQLTPGDSEVGGTLSFHAVCTPAAYREFSSGQFCSGVKTVLYNGGGSIADGVFKDQASCREECDQDPRCNFFLWKHEALASWVNHCATFTNCKSPEKYTDGNTAAIFQKIAPPAQIKPPAPIKLQSAPKPPGHVGADQKTRTAPSNGIGNSKTLGVRFRSLPSDSDNNLHKLKQAERLRKLQRVESGVDSFDDDISMSSSHDLDVKPTPKPTDVNAAGAWFACQLVSAVPGRHERVVFTSKNMVILTKTVRDADCRPTQNKLHCSSTEFYTGKWSTVDSNMVLKWNGDKLPAQTWITYDEGNNFVERMVNKYACSSPPSLIKQLVEKKEHTPVAAAGAWFACQLVSAEPGRHERIMWTAKKMAIMASTVRETHCEGNNTLHCSSTKFYTGKWSVDGANVLMTWDKLPPMRFATADGGYNFYSEDIMYRITKRYTCSTPPLELKQLVAAGIQEAKEKLAIAQRLNAGLPTDYTPHGCMQLVMEPVQESVMVLGGGMTLEKCFVHCKKAKGMNYFVVTRGDSCFCSDTDPGNSVDASKCDLTCSGNDKQYCGGYSMYASAYTMIDCMAPDDKELREVSAAKDARLRAVYSTKKAQTCGLAQGNDLEIDGHKWMTARPKDCQRTCFYGKGAGSCHGFTYNTLTRICTFHKDAFWGNSTKDPNSSCYFKKSVPLR